MFSVNLPIGIDAGNQCGKAVHIDAHVNHVIGSESVGPTYPQGCAASLKPAENLLAVAEAPPTIDATLEAELDPPEPA